MVLLRILLSFVVSCIFTKIWTMKLNPGHKISQIHSYFLFENLADRSLCCTVKPFLWKIVSGSMQHYKRKTTVQLSLIDLFGMLYSAHRLTLFASVYSLPRSSYFEQAKLLGAYGSPCSHFVIQFAEKTVSIPYFCCWIMCLMVAIFLVAGLRRAWGHDGRRWYTGRLPRMWFLSRALVWPSSCAPDW